MVDLAHPGSLLDQMTSHFTTQGWPVTDLARFHMAADDDTGDGDDDGVDDTTGGTADGSQTLSSKEIADLRKALHSANKEAEQRRLKLKEYEDRDKSETEKLTERTRELETTLTSAQLTALRFEIALDKGIPKSIASRLQGSTREEMEADAEELVKQLGTAKSGGQKTPRFDGGAKDASHEGGSFLAQALRNRRTA